MTGGVVEQKPIGIPIATDGTFSNTILIDGKIQLKATSETPLTYPQIGLWTSKIVDIGDNFKEYGKILITSTNENGSTVSISTRSSTNGTAFSPWQKTESDGTIISPKGRYIQVRLEFHAGFTVEDIIIATEDLVGNNKFAEEYIVTPRGSAIPALTSNAQTANGIPFANSTYGGGNDIWRAFDKTATHYTSAGGVIVGFIGYKFTEKKIIDKYELTSPNITTQTTMINTWFFEASDDTMNGTDGNWTILDTKSGYSWTQAQKREFVCQNDKDFLAYRLRWTANNGNTSNTSIGELDMVAPDMMGTQLKHNYKNVMIKDNTWSDTGELHRVTVNKSDFLNIKSMSMIDGFATESVTAVPIMTSNTAPSGLVEASSVFDNDSRYMAWKAFDGLTGVTASAWIAKTVTNEWISYEFTEPVIINSYSIVPNLLMNGSQPKDFRFEAWNGSQWINLDTQSNITTGWAANVHKHFRAKNNVAYKKYRLFVVSNNGFANYMSIAELGMYKKKEVK